ncbi:pentatricopeptide repeat-containing protein, partial [Tanacetum coccineum]
MTVVTYTTMIKGYVESMVEEFGIKSVVKEADNAFKLFKEMKGFGINPNAINYSAFLLGLCKDDKMMDAHTILKEM